MLTEPKKTKDIVRLCRYALKYIDTFLIDRYTSGVYSYYMEILQQDDAQDAAQEETAAIELQTHLEEPDPINAPQGSEVAAAVPCYGSKTVGEFSALTKDIYTAIQNNKKTLTIFLIAVFSVCVVLMVVASIWDYAISTALESPYGSFSWFLQDFGEWPAPFIINVGFPVVLTVWLIRRRKKGNYLFLLGIIPASNAFLFGYFFTAGVLTDITWVAVVIMLAGIAAFTVAAFLIPQKHLIKIMYFLMIAFIVANLAYFLMLFTKWLWGRVRFRDLYAYSEIGFSHWFIINGPNGHEAFFSGHVLAALSFTFVWMIPPIFKVKNKIAIALMYGISAFIGVSMMWGRIVTGAHYLSDVTFSVIVFVSFNMLVLTFIFFRNLRKQKKSDKLITKAACVQDISKLGPYEEGK